jgi:hypothetical protein
MAYDTKDQWDRYIYLRDHGHFDFVEKADQCENFFAGAQWSSDDLAALKEANRPAMTINKILATLGIMMGEQITNRTEVLFRPLKHSPSEIADALTMVWAQIGQNNQLSWLRSDVFADGLIRGRGFYDARMCFEDSVFGEVRIKKLNGKNVLIDPDAEDYDPDTWSDVITTKWLNPDDIAVLYDKGAADELRDKMSYAAPGEELLDMYRDSFAGVRQFNESGPEGYNLGKNVRVIERQYRKLDKQEHFVDMVTGDMRPIPKDWDRNRISALLEKMGSQVTTTKKLIKRVRMVATAADVMLHDEWSPYKRLTVIPYFPYFRYGKTIGVVENLMGPQEILNKVSSQELHIVNTTANSGWAVEEDSLVNMTVGELEVRGAKTGLVVEYRKGAQPPTKIQPNQPPSGLDRISMKAEDHIKSISNISDSMMGQDRADVAAKAIAYKQQRGAVSMSKMLDNLERSDWFLARHVLDLVQTFYSNERMVQITKDDFTNESSEITVNTVDELSGEIVNDLTIGEYSVVITSSPYRASLEDSQFEQARALRELGIAIPDSVLIENSRLQRRAEVLKLMAEQMSSPQAQAQAELAQRDAVATIGLKEANIEKIRANTQMLLAKTQTELTPEPEEAEPEGGGEAAIEGAKLRAEMEAENQKLELERYKIDKQLELERYKIDKEFELQREQAERDAAQQRADRIRQANAASATAQATTTTAQEK